MTQCAATSLGGTRCVLDAGHGDIHQGGAVVREKPRPISVQPLTPRPPT